MLASGLFVLISVVSSAASSPLTQKCSELVRSLAQNVDKSKLGFFPDFNASEGTQLLRKSWNFLPLQDPRNHTLGIQFDQLSSDEQRIVTEVLDLVLSSKGVSKVKAIRAHDQFLFDHPEWIDPRFKKENYGKDQYRIAIFGEPSPLTPWMFRLQGHHLSVNATVVNDKIVSLTPLFFGEYPQVNHLDAQEMAARALAIQLDERAAPGVGIDGQLPRRIYLLPEASPLAIEPRGIAYDKLNEQERIFFDITVLGFLVSLPEPLRTEKLNRFQAIKEVAPEKLFFRWIGKTDPGAALHFYIQIDPGLEMIFEHQNLDGHHIHSIFRDYPSDFGGAKL